MRQNAEMKKELLKYKGCVNKRQRFRNSKIAGVDVNTPQKGADSWSALEEDVVKIAKALAYKNNVAQ